MRGRDLARQDDLHAGEHAAGDAGFARHAGILQHQHAALGFLGGDDLAGFHQIGAHVAPFPDRRHARAFRLIEHEVAEDAPERRQMLLAGPAIELHAALFGLAVDGMRKAVFCHRNLLAKSTPDVQKPPDSGAKTPLLSILSRGWRESSAANGA